MDASKIKLIIWDLDETFWNGTISEQKVAPVKQACDLVLLSSKKGIVNSICSKNDEKPCIDLSLIHISEPTRRTPISYAVFCLKKKKKKQ